MEPSLDILYQQSEIQNVHLLKHEDECKKTSLDSRVSFNLGKIDLLVHHAWDIAMTLTPRKDHILKEK